MIIVHPCSAALNHQMAGGCSARGVKEVFSTSEAEELAGPEHRGAAAGGPRPQMVFHLLCFHTELPSSQLWESALRASSDPTGSAVVTAHPLPELQFVLSPPHFWFFPSLSLSLSLTFFPFPCAILVFGSCWCEYFELIAVFPSNESKTPPSVTKM